MRITIDCTKRRRVGGPVQVGVHADAALPHDERQVPPQPVGVERATGGRLVLGQPLLRIAERGVGAPHPEPGHVLVGIADVRQLPVDHGASPGRRSTMKLPAPTSPCTSDGRSSVAGTRRGQDARRREPHERLLQRAAVAGVARPPARARRAARRPSWRTARSGTPPGRRRGHRPRAPGTRAPPPRSRPGRGGSCPGTRFMSRPGWIAGRAEHLGHGPARAAAATGRTSASRRQPVAPTGEAALAPVERDRVVTGPAGSRTS